MKKIFFLLLLFLSYFSFSLDFDLSLGYDDLLIEEDEQLGGINLYIRRKEGVNSVLLVESVFKKDCFLDVLSYRALSYNEINGNERRKLNGEFVENLEGAKFSLISSSVLKNYKSFDEYFLIFIPYKIVFGKEDGFRFGTVDIRKGFYFSVRTFTNPYAEYRDGNYRDNSFTLKKVFYVEGE